MLSGSGQVPTVGFYNDNDKGKEIFDCQLFLHGLSHIVDYTMIMWDAVGLF